jgi:O-antigen/teichoic acid export membrane protein
LTGSHGRAAPARRGGKAYLAASFAAQLCALARYTLLARLLGPEQLGIAVALILTAQFFESVTDSGSDRFLIQDKDGDEAEVQRLVHLVWLTRGLLIAGILAALSMPLATFYGLPELQTGFLILAISPLIAGAAHLDYRRQQRKSDFRGESRLLVTSELASLLVTAVTAFIFRDFTAILYGLITRSAVIMVMSHVVAERRYSVGFASPHARRLGAFALPLMVNGLLLFLGSQGDRLLIGKQVGLTELGHYTAAMLLIFYPSAIIARYVSAIHLPLIARAEGEQARRAAIERLGGQTLLLALAMAAGFALLAPTAIVLLYGSRFALPAVLVAAIGLLQSLRFLRLWPVTVALGIGRSGLVLASNLLRLTAFPLSLLGYQITGDIFGILLGFLVAEFLSLVATLAGMNRLTAQPVSDHAGRAALFASASGAMIAWAAISEQPTLLNALMAGVASLIVLIWLYRREKATAHDGVEFVKRLAAARKV